MTQRTRRILLVLASVAGVVALLPAVGAWRWRRATASTERELIAAARTDASVALVRDGATLPPPVERYLHRALRGDQSDIQLAEITHEGTFQMGTDEHGWRPFRSRQVFTARPAGFVWDAAIRYTPLTPVFVRDALVSGAGSTDATVLGLITVASQHDQRGLDAGALQRWLAETIWFPTVLLPGGDITWTAIDDRRALASVSAADTVMSIEFRFNDAGDVVELFSPARAREVDVSFVPTPWIVRCTEHADWHRVRIPVACTVAWQLPQGELTYWRGRITGVRYDVAERR